MNCRQLQLTAGSVRDLIPARLVLEDRAGGGYGCSFRVSARYTVDLDFVGFELESREQSIFHSGLRP